MGVITWGGGPLAIVLSESGNRVLAVCCAKGGEDRVDYVLQSRTLEGKELSRKKLLSTPLTETQLNASIQREGNAVRVKLYKGGVLRANVTAEETE